MNSTSIRTVQVSPSFRLRPLAAVALVAALGAVRVVPAQEHPPQREWVYTEHADAATGEQQPAAFLMSRNIISASASMGHGYLAVRNDPKRPMETTLSWDAPPSKGGAVDCKPSGCQLKVRFGTTVNTFSAVPQKNSPGVVLQDGHAFVTAATRHSGSIEVQFQTVSNEQATYQFSTASPLRVEKLSKGKK